MERSRSSIGRKYEYYRDGVPFAGTLMVEFIHVGSNTLFKAASTQGMNHSIFILYSYTLSVLVLLPLAFTIHRKAQLPPLDRSVIGRICLLGILGFTYQTLGFKGIEYSSPTLGSAMTNLQSAFTFVLAIIFRMEKLELRSTTTVAKIIGTSILISGAFIVTVYKGPTLLTTTLPLPLPLPPSFSPNQPLKSSPSSWAIGGLLLIASNLLISVWYIVQAQTVKRYPAEFVIVTFYNLCIAIISLPVCLLFEPNLSTWRLSTNTSLTATIFTGVVRTALGTVIHTWSVKVKGPVFVALFKPLSIIIAAIVGLIFLHEALHLGSVVGAIVISLGFYIVMWAKAKEDMTEEFEATSMEESPPIENVPLLQKYNNHGKV